MTHELDCTLPEEFLEPILEHGLDALPELIRTVINAAMELERQHLAATPYERTEKRRGYANGYKSKTVATRLGKITFDVPQVREGGFYPSALEKGIRSERALRHSQRAGAEVGPGRDVRSGHLHETGSGDHRAVVWL